MNTASLETTLKELRLSGLGQTLLRGGERIHLAGHVRVNEWQGEKRIQLHIGDAAVAG